MDSYCMVSFFFNDTATTDIYTYCHTLSLPDARPIWQHSRIIAAWSRISWPQAIGTVRAPKRPCSVAGVRPDISSSGMCSQAALMRSEEHTSELQSLMRTSYAVFCLKNKNLQTISYKRDSTSLIQHRYPKTPTA